MTTKGLGTKFAPVDANLFITRLEERLVDTSVEKPLIWIRYIDDMFFILMHGEAKLKEFIDHLNSSHDTIKFTSEHSRDSISFINVQVTLSEGGVLSTYLFCKPTDTHQYLHDMSCDQWHTKKAIPYSQALRYRWICSEDRFFEDKVGELAGWLKDRGYEESKVDEQVFITKDQGRGERVPFVLTYHPALNGLGKAAGKLQSMLSHSGEHRKDMLVRMAEHRKVFPAPAIIALRRCKNLKDILVRARLSNRGQGGTHTKGCSGCGEARCQVCNVMSNCDSFKSKVTGKEYKINYWYNCDSSNVVYLLECNVCGVQYVGSTNTPFRLRFNNYKAFFKGNRIFKDN